MQATLTLQKVSMVISRYKKYFATFMYAYIHTFLPLPGTQGWGVRHDRKPPPLPETEFWLCHCYLGASLCTRGVLCAGCVIWQKFLHCPDTVLCLYICLWVLWAASSGMLGFCIGVWVGLGGLCSLLTLCANLYFVRQEWWSGMWTFRGHGEVWFWIPPPAYTSDCRHCDGIHNRCWCVLRLAAVPSSLVGQALQGFTSKA